MNRLSLAETKGSTIQARRASRDFAAVMTQTAILPAYATLPAYRVFFPHIQSTKP
jgi:hypothetical protein